MNTFLKIILGGFLPILLFSCNRNEKKELVKTVDMKSITEGKFDDYVDDIDCFPLKKSEYPFFDCWKLITYKGYYYLYSLSDFMVQIYDEKGTFIKRIDSRGKGKIETPTDILINEENNQLWICDSRYKLNKYTLQGDFIESVQFSVPFIKIISVDKQRFLVYESLLAENREHLFSLYTDGLNEIKSFVEKGKISRKSPSYPPSLFTKDLDGNVYVLLGEKQMIYKYKDENLEPFISLNFQGDFLTEDKYPTQGFSDEQMSEIIKQNKYIYAIRNFGALSQKLFFKTIGKETMYYLIDCAELGGVKFRSLFDGYIPKMTNPVAGSDGHYLYLVQKKKDLVNHYKDKECHYDAIKQIIHSDEQLDGVIIRIKLK